MPYSKPQVPTCTKQEGWGGTNQDPRSVIAHLVGLAVLLKMLKANTNPQAPYYNLKFLLAPNQRVRAEDHHNSDCSTISTGIFHIDLSTFCTKPESWRIDSHRAPHTLFATMPHFYLHLPSQKAESRKSQLRSLNYIDGHLPHWPVDLIYDHHTVIQLQLRFIFVEPN